MPGSLTVFAYTFAVYGITEGEQRPLSLSAARTA
jgi:hypothetical protein